MKKYFSIRSLIQINEYFQQSRLLYGVNVFLPLIKITKKVEASCNRFLRSVLGLRYDFNADMLHILIGKGRFENHIMPRLVEVINKYKNHFKEFPSKYYDIWKQFWDWINEDSEDYEPLYGDHYILYI